MKPLLYLTARTLLNGIKRALTSGRRLVGLLAFFVYYWYLSVGQFMGRSAPADVSPSKLKFALPPYEVLDACVFTGFSFLVLLFSIGVFGSRGGFKPADVDVLFPTPVSPRLVLVFRLVREYLITLIVPLLLALIGWRGTAVGIKAIFANFPEHGSLVFRAISVSWILLALVWVAIGFAISLFVNRSDLRSDRNRTLIAIGIFALTIIVIGYVGVELRQDLSWRSAMEITQSPLLRVVFFSASAATAVVMAPLHQAGLDVAQLTAGLGALVLLIVGALRVALSQSAWMYDQAAARGFDQMTLRSLQRQGDTFALYAEHARRGKVKTGRLAAWVSGWRVKGGLALLWKETVLQTRIGFLMLVGFVLIVTFMVAMVVYATESSRASSIAFLAMQGLGVFIVAMSLAQTGFIELLRRVDVQKPLPFTPATIIFWEVAAKVIPTVIAGAFASIVALVIKPALWLHAIAALLMMPSFGMLLVATVLLMILLFPDIEDPTQRGFRGVMMMLGIACLGFPSIALTGLLLYYKVHPILAAIPVAGLNLAITIGVAAVAGSLYASFNPSE